MPPATRSTTNRESRLADPYKIPSSTTPLTPSKTPKRPRKGDGSKNKNKVKDPDVKEIDLDETNIAVADLEGIKEKTARIQDFLASLVPVLKCNRCEEIVNEPYIWDCEHTFCAKCLSRYQRELGKTFELMVCPTKECGERAVLGPFENRQMEEVAKIVARAKDLKRGDWGSVLWPGWKDYWWA